MSTLLDSKAKLSSSDAPPVEPVTTLWSGRDQEHPSYPPTEVQRWLTCPIYRDYLTRWVPRAEEWTPPKLVESAIHAGVAAYLRPQIEESTCLAIRSPEAVAAAACDVLRVSYVKQETWGIERLEALVKKGVTLLVRRLEEELLPGATILGVETVDPHSALPPAIQVPRILDCILERDGFLEVWDWKSKMRCDGQYMEEAMREILHSWQLLDYAWHAQQWFQKPVRYVGHGLVMLGSQFKVKFVSTKVSEERLNQWYQDAQQIWREMWHEQMGHIMPIHNWMACTDRQLHDGRECVMLPACHRLLGDESKFSGLYKIREHGT